MISLARAEKYFNFKNKGCGSCLGVVFRDPPLQHLRAACEDFGESYWLLARISLRALPAEVIHPKGPMSPGLSMSCPHGDQAITL